MRILVSIPSFSEETSWNGTETYTVYHIFVTIESNPSEARKVVYTHKFTKNDSFKDEQSWKVKHRFNDFYELHNTLKQKGYKNITSFAFPSKNPSLVQSKDATASFRKQVLEMYLLEVLTIDPIPVALLEFLEIQESSLPVSSEQPRNLELNISPTQNFDSSNSSQPVSSSSKIRSIFTFINPMNAFTLLTPQTLGANGDASTQSSNLLNLPKDDTKFIIFVVQSIIFSSIVYIVYRGLELVNNPYHSLSKIYLFIRTIRRAVSIELETSVILAILLMTAHRILGYFATQYLQMKLSKPDGSYNITIDWVSLRFGLDRNEVVVFGTTFHNPPAFNQTPYFIRVDEISIHLDVANLIDIFVYGNRSKSIQIPKIELSGVNCYIEKAQKKSQGVNIWAALGAVNEDNEKDVQSYVFRAMATASSLAGPLSKFFAAAKPEEKPRETLPPIVGVKAEAKSPSSGDSSAPVRVIEGHAISPPPAVEKRSSFSTLLGNHRPLLSSVHNLTNAIGSLLTHDSTNFLHDQPDQRSQNQSKQYQQPLSSIQNTSVESSHDDHDIPIQSIYDNGEAGEYFDEDSEDESSALTWRSVGDSNKVSGENQPIKTVSADNKGWGVPYTFEVDRITVIELKLHAQDLLTAQHIDVKNASSINIDVINMSRRDLTKFTKKNQNRKGLRADELTWRIIFRVSTELFKTNQISMMMILATATANQTANAVLDVAKLATQGVTSAVFNYNPVQILKATKKTIDKVVNPKDLLIRSQSIEILGVTSLKVRVIKLRNALVTENGKPTLTMKCLMRLKDVISKPTEENPNNKEEFNSELIQTSALTKDRQDEINYNETFFLEPVLSLDSVFHLRIFEAGLLAKNIFVGEMYLPIRKALRSGTVNTVNNLSADHGNGANWGLDCIGCKEEVIAWHRVYDKTDRTLIRGEVRLGLSLM